MFRNALLLSLSLFLSTVAMCQLDEHFSTPGFENYAQWSGLTTHFSVNTSERLQLNAPAAGQSYVVANFDQESLDEKEWRLWIKQSFAGSDNNQSRYYLATNGATLAYSGTTATAGVQGYFLRFGEGGSADAVRLYRDNGSGNATLILSGVDGAIASSFEVRIKVTRNSAGVWSLFADYTGGDAFVLEGTATDATYTNTSNIGIVCNYTSSNLTNFQFDDLYFGPIVIDTTPPSVQNVAVLSVNSLAVQFTESVSQSTAQILTNYQWIGQGNPLSAVAAGNVVTLTFAQDFPENVQQTLLVAGVEDLAGNEMNPASENFLWFIPATATFRQVVFNEIMDDPTPMVGLPDAEYIELLNNSSEPFDLAGWTLVNSTTPKVLASYVLAPGAHVILCNATQSDLFAGLPVLGISGFVALVNGNDSLTLLNPQGAIIDYVAYKGAWHDGGISDGGYSLELVNPDLSCQSGTNWRTSLSETGGTPGAANSVLDTTPDNVSPVAESVSAISLSELIVWFSEAIAPGEAEVTISGGPTVVIAETIGENKLQVILADVLEYGTTYTLTVSGVSDCSGNTAASQNLDFALGFPVQAGDIIINEIMAAPSENTLSPNAEYVELYNRSEKLLDLSGIKINNGIPALGHQLEPGGYVVYTRTSDVVKFGENPNVLGMNSFPLLTNAGLTLQLFGSQGEILDIVAYTDKWYVTPGTSAGGYSLELINPYAPCSDASNWRASAHPTGGTPGVQNANFDSSPDNQSPLLSYVLAPASDYFTLVFNETVDPEQEPTLTAELWVASESGFELADIAVTGIAHNPETPNRLSITTEIALPVGKKYSLRLLNVADCSGNSGMVEAIIAHPEFAQINDVIINEVLSNPRTGGKDFVEIYNRSMRNLSLEGWALANMSNNTPENIRKFTEEPLLLLSGGYLAISSDTRNIKQEYPLASDANLWLTPSMPSYNNDNGTVVLLDFLQQEMDKVSYDVSMHFALLDDVKGVSFERISPDRPSNDVTNWTSAAQTAGWATPGYQNSQYSPAGFSPSAFSAEPEIFSPDNDGFNDLVHFHFQMDQPGYAGSITIYDSDGRIVRRLIRNELLSVSGSYSWDGIDDRLSKAPIGIYLAVFEYFSPDGRTGSAKTVCVLGHRLN